MTTVNLSMNLDSIYFNLIKNKKKLYETRVLDDKRKKIKLLDVVEFKEGGTTRTFKAIITELSYFSNFERREVLVNCTDISIKADLLKNKITFSKGEETFFNNFDISSTYIQQHDAILGKDYTNLCSLEEGQQVMRLIDQIRAK